jgi:class 3 adenylate cyclase
MKSPIEEEAGRHEPGLLARFVAEQALDIEHRFVGLRRLLEATDRIDPGVLLDEVLRQVHETFRGVLPCERTGFALLDEAGEVLRTRWQKTAAPEARLPADYSAPMAGSSLAGVMASGEPRIIADLATYLAKHPDSRATTLLLAEGMRSSLTCPLAASGKPVGFLFFSSQATNAYTDAHVQALRNILPALSAVIVKARLYEMVIRAQLESERLLRNVLPEPIVKRLKAGEQTIADGIPAATVVFVDLVNFVNLSATMSPSAVVIVLNRIFSAFDALCEKYGVEKIKTIGDAYMLATGVPKPFKEHVSVAAKIAIDMQELGKRLGTREVRSLSFRIGIHTGPVVAGIIGTRKFSYDLWGDTVNIASRMESNGAPGRIHVTRAVYEVLRDEFDFEPRGLTHLKGIGDMETYFLIDAKPGSLYRATTRPMPDHSSDHAPDEDDGDPARPGRERRQPDR